MKPTNLIQRGRCRPTGAWIASYKGKLGTTYRVRWADPRTGAILTTPCGRDRSFARQVRDSKKAELRDGLAGKIPNKTVQELLDELGMYMASKSGHTIRKTKCSLAELIKLSGNRILAHVDRSMMMEYRSKRLETGVAIATVNKDVRQIKSALSYAVDAGWLRSNPLWRWKALQLRDSEKVVRVVEPAEFEVVLKSCPNPTVRVALIVAYYQGLRRTELCNLRWVALDLDGGILRVVNVADAGEFTKSRKNRTIPMHGTVKRELAKMAADAPKVVKDGASQFKHAHCFTDDAGQPFKSDWLTHEFARIVKRSGVVHCTLHDLRRSFSTLAQRAGVDKHTVKDLGGWSTVSVVEKHYTGETPDVFRRAMQTIERAAGVA